MSQDTDAYEIDPRGYQDPAYARPHSAFNGSSKFVNFMLSIIALLLVSAIGGAVSVAIDVASIKVEVKYLREEVRDIKDGGQSGPAAAYRDPR